MRNYYQISYYNKAFKNNYTIKLDDREEAIQQAKKIKALPEMKNVQLDEVKEIDFEAAE